MLRGAENTFGATSDTSYWMKAWPDQAPVATCVARVRCAASKKRNVSDAKVCEQKGRRPQLRQRASSYLHRTNVGVISDADLTRSLLLPRKFHTLRRASFNELTAIHPTAGSSCCRPPRDHTLAVCETRRDVDKAFVDRAVFVSDTAVTAQLRKLLHKYNEASASTHNDVLSLHVDVESRPLRLCILQQRAQTARIFAGQRLLHLALDGFFFCRLGRIF
jgi:hypothetical protein